MAIIATLTSRKGPKRLSPNHFFISHDQPPPHHLHPGLAFWSIAFSHSFWQRPPDSTARPPFGSIISFPLGLLPEKNYPRPSLQTISYLFPGRSLSRADPAYLLRFVSYTAFYFTFRIVEFRRYYPYLVISATIFLFIGFFQYFLLPDTRFLTYLGFDDHYFRLIGSLIDPNFTGLVLVVFTLLAPKRFFVVPLLALALTFSRASFLALAVSLVYLSFTKKQFKLLFLLLILGVFLYFAPKPFGEGVNLFRTFSIISRFENQKQALAIFLKNPILGVGFGPRKIDNSFIFVLATTGTVGFIAFMAFLKKAWQVTPDPLIKAALLAVLVHSLFNNSLFYSWILALFFLLVSLRPTKSA